MLTDTAIRKSQPTAKLRRIADGNGLCLEIAPEGGKRWRLRYRFLGKAKMLSLGTYPEVGLKEAREKCDSARALLRRGIDPSQDRKDAKTSATIAAINTFEAVAREWLAKFSPRWGAVNIRIKTRLFERDVFPYIGARPIAKISPPEILEVLNRIEKRGTLETAHRCRINCGLVFRYAISSARAERDPTRDLRGALPPVKVKHMAAVTKPNELAPLLRSMWGYEEGTPVVAAALKLQAMLFTRPGELRHAKWADVYWDEAQWSYTTGKTGQAHVVPLCRQAVEILRGLQPLTGEGLYVFPSARSKSRPMSDAAVNAALRYLGIDKETATGHGFRATARTLLEEELGFPYNIIEQQLAHRVRDPNGRAYNRTMFLPERRVMMQAWADFLDGLRSKARPRGAS